MSKLKISSDGRTITVRVPISIKKSSGRRLVLLPEGVSSTAVPRRYPIDNALVKAIARAFRWREMLESGRCATIREIAGSEKLNESYVGRVLRLTLLAPDIVEAILGGKQPVALQLDNLMVRLPIPWEAQLRQFGLANGKPDSSRGRAVCRAA